MERTLGLAMELFAERNCGRLEKRNYGLRTSREMKAGVPRASTATCGFQHASPRDLGPGGPTRGTAAPQKIGNSAAQIFRISRCVDRLQELTCRRGAASFFSASSSPHQSLSTMSATTTETTTASAPATTASKPLGMRVNGLSISHLSASSRRPI